MSNDGTYGGYRPSHLDKSVDRALNMINQAFLADPQAQADAVTTGDRWRHLWHAEEAAGPHGVVLPLALARDLLSTLEGDGTARLSLDMQIALLKGHLDRAPQRPERED